MRQSGNYTTQEVQPGAGFVIHGRYPRQVPPPGQPMNFGVVLPDADPTAIVVVTTLLLNPQERAMITNLEPEVRERLFSGIADDLFFNCGFVLQRDPNTHEYLGISLSEEMYDDRPLTQDALMSTLRRIFTGALLFSKRIQEAGPRPIVEP